MSDRKALQRRLAALSTRRLSDAGGGNVVYLGGVGVYAPESVDIQSVVQELGEVLSAAAVQHLSLDRAMLRRAMSELAGTEIDDRIFGALLGRALRLGHIVGVPCLSESQRVFRVYVAATRFPEFRSGRSLLCEQASKSSSVSVREAERVVLGERRWGTWSSACHILASAAESGHLIRLDKNTFCWPREIHSAVCSDP